MTGRPPAELVVVQARKGRRGAHLLLHLAHVNEYGVGFDRTLCGQAPASGLSAITYWAPVARERIHAACLAKVIDGDTITGAADEADR